MENNEDEIKCYSDILPLRVKRFYVSVHQHISSILYVINYSNELFQRLVVCLEESLYIHNIRDMKVLHTIRDTPANPKGICALSPHNENAYLAYPGSIQAGEVQIFDTVTLVCLFSTFICCVAE